MFVRACNSYTRGDEEIGPSHLSRGDKGKQIP